MPSDVAVDQPSSRVILLKGNGKVAAAWERCNVSTRRVNKVELAGVNVEYAGSLTHNPKIVAVEMDRMIQAVEVSQRLVKWMSKLTYPVPLKS